MNKLTLFITFMLCTSIFAQEICDDGIDNDADGLIDLQDTTDCNCAELSAESLIPNPSFEDHTCCPSGISQLNCADNWVQASGATSDYFNTCGFTNIGLIPPPDLPLPGAPGGTGYAGFFNNPLPWKEYIGACLLGTMNAGTPYVLSCWLAHGKGVPNLNISIYGTPNCADIPWTGSACPVGSGGWMLLDDFNVIFTSLGQWTQATLYFTPTVDINAVAIGADCPIGPPSNYYYIDELILVDSLSTTVSTNISESGNWCNGDLELNVTVNTLGGSWQWYKDSIALVGETAVTLDLMPYGAGSYTAIYTLNNQCNALDYNVTVPEIPNANFLFNNVCDGETANFTDNSIVTVGGSIVNWEWDFGDGGTSTLEDPAHIYTVPGIYTVQLEVTTDLGCTDTVLQNIQVFDLPSADFDVVDICVGQPSMFTDLSVGPAIITAWDWNFDDGGTSLSANPNHLYAGSGSYNVTLEVTDANGCTSSVANAHNVTAMPLANFNFSNICLTDAAAFTDASSVIGGNVSQWMWDFGDGNTSSATDPIHNFTSAGTYPVQLICLVDTILCSDTITQNITIYPIPQADFITDNVCEGEPTMFTDASTVPAPDVIDSWDWNFGDATTSTVQSPAHQYGSPGSYTVTLTVSTDNGCLNTFSSPIEVFETPIADFSSTSVCENDVPTTFTDLSSAQGSSILTWSWDFGDGNASSFSDPSHNYIDYGTYTTTLTVTSVEGCVSSVNHPVSVWEKPTANFTADKTEICDPDCINFLDLSTVTSASIIDWKWDFDVSSLNGYPNPNQCFGTGNTSVKYYDVGLIVFTDKGCTDTLEISDYIKVVPTPIAGFSFNPQIISVDETEVNFDNNSLYANSYYWNFGDGSPLHAAENPIHTFPQWVPQNYLVELIAYSEGELCSDTVQQVVIIQDILLYYVPNVFTPDGDEYNETFQPVFTTGYDPTDFHLLIFNRWGEVLFESYDASHGWNGTYRNNGLVKDGIYIWQIEFKETMSDKKHGSSGHVTVLR